MAKSKASRSKNKRKSGKKSRSLKQPVKEPVETEPIEVAPGIKESFREVPEKEPEKVEPEKIEPPPKPEFTPEELAEQQRRRDMEIAKKSGLLSLLKNTEIDVVSDEILDKTLSGMRVITGKRSSSSRPGVNLQVAKASGGIDSLLRDLEAALKDSKVNKGCQV